MLANFAIEVTPHLFFLTILFACMFIYIFITITCSYSVRDDFKNDVCMKPFRKRFMHVFKSFRKCFECMTGLDVREVGSVLHTLILCY